MSDLAKTATTVRADTVALTATAGPGRPPANRAPRRQVAASTASHLLLAVIGLAFVLPMLWLLFAAFDAKASWGIEWPHLTLENFAATLHSTELQALANSLILSMVATAVATACALPSAYALSRRRIPFKGPILLGVLFLTGVPLAILIIPVYQMFAEIGWLSILPAGLFLAVTSLPFEIFLIKNFIDAVPQDLEEAARLERATTWQVLSRVVLPLATPGICAAAIFGFVNAWGSFIVPLILITAAGQQVGPIAIYNFVNGYEIHYGEIAAFSVVFALPVVILYGFASRFFREGFVLGGAVKG